MESYLYSGHWDLVSPDGKIKNLKKIDDRNIEAVVRIENIAPVFKGFEIDPCQVFFNLKSTLAQLGLNGTGLEYFLDRDSCMAEVKVLITAHGEIARKMLTYIQGGSYVGKLFAADDRRRVRNPDYLSRMFSRGDREGRPLLSLGGMRGSNELVLEKVDGRTVAYLSLLPGRIRYDEGIFGFLPTLAKGLRHCIGMRELLRLHQNWETGFNRFVDEDAILLVRSLPLHIRTVFGHVIDELLPRGCSHTTASILQPDTTHSGDVYELYGYSEKELVDIPLEFFTLEPHREHVFFTDRDQLQTCLEDEATLQKAFDTAPGPQGHGTAVFIVKGEQLLDLKESDWVCRERLVHSFPGISQGTRQKVMLERFIDQQASTPFLKAIQNGLITSEGVLLLRYFPSPVMKSLLLSDQVKRNLKGIYFQSPSVSQDDFFTQEDRAMMVDLCKFAIPLFWVDAKTKTILQYVEQPGKDSGMFVPRDEVSRFLQATIFGIYGSNLLEGDFEKELEGLMAGIRELKTQSQHHLLNPETPLALVTGGGPGAMEVGNRVAKKLGILSCANIVDFRPKDGGVVNEQIQNPFVEAKMTYRLEKLVERQAEFNLDFPIFLLGGIGTDFEYCLEEVRRKVGVTPPTPILLFGPEDYWKAKISSRFNCNMETGTIKGSEWISNCFYCIQTAEQGIFVYKEFFEGRLPIGPDGPVYDQGFMAVGSTSSV